MFDNARRIGLIPPGTPLLNDRQELLLQGILQKWSLSASITLTDLLGIEIFDLLSQTLDEAKDPAIATAFQELLTTFEAEYAIVFISFMGQKDCTESPDREKYLDNKFLLTHQKACARLGEKLREQLIGVTDAIRSHEEEIKARYRNQPRILNLKTTHIASYRSAIESFNERKDLFLSLMKSPHYLGLLLDNNTLRIFEKDALKINDPSEGLLCHKRLTQFQMKILVTAQQKGFIGVGIKDFIALAESFPDVTTVESLKTLRTNAMRLIKGFAKTIQQAEQAFQLAKENKLTHSEYCLMHQIPLSTEKTQAQFTSDQYAKTMTITLICNFFQDIYIAVDERLLPLVSPEYINKYSVLNRMAINFNNFYSLPDILQKDLNATDFIIESLFSDSENQKPFARNMHSVGLPFMRELQRCCGIPFQAFLPFMKDFNALLDETIEINSYSPVQWSHFFNAVKPVVEEQFPTTLQRIQYLHEDSLKWIQQELETIPSPEEKMLFVQEFKEFLFKSSLTLCQLVMFYADLRSLMDYYDSEQIESEDYLLPQELTDFLELKGLDEQLFLPPEIETPAFEEPSSDLTEIDSSTSISSEDEKSTPHLLPPKKKKPFQKKTPPKKPQTPRKKSSPSKPSITHAEALFKIRRGEKALDILKRIKRELGLTPDRIRGGHIIFSGGATLPSHGGNNTLPPGTARSLEKQLTEQMLHSESSKKC